MSRFLQQKPDARGKRTTQRGHTTAQLNSNGNRALQEQLTNNTLLLHAAQHLALPPQKHTKNSRRTKHWAPPPAGRHRSCVENTNAPFLPIFVLTSASRDTLSFSRDTLHWFPRHLSVTPVTPLTMALPALRSRDTAGTPKVYIVFMGSCVCLPKMGQPRSLSFLALSKLTSGWANLCQRP